jgi:hypothetical protein
MDTKGIVNLDYVVRLVLMDLDDYSMNNYKKFLQYAILGFTDLNLSTIQSLKVAYLTVNPNTKTVDLPDDYIDYSKIGYDGGGVIKTLSLNNDLMLVRETDDCGNGINQNGEDCAGDLGGIFPYSYYYAPHYRGGQYVGELYGGNGGHNSSGYYRIDEEKRQICLSSEVSTNTIILEYKSSGVSGNGSTMIPRECVEALRAYIHWQRKAYNDAVPQSDKERLRQSYYIEFEKLRDYELAFTKEEYYDSRRSSYSQSPKR